MEGFGAINWWGFSPALDLLSQAPGEDFCESLGKLNLTSTTASGEVNILLLGTGDSRHIIKTIARSYHRPNLKLNFYVIEGSMELYARHMLFLALTLEPQTRLGLQDKTEMFLEIHGNSLVRRQTMEYVESISNELIKMVTDFDYLNKRLPILDLSSLKFKERDMLEGIFKFWRNKDVKNLFDITKCWDLRLRQYLGVRYDAIPNVFDWDFHMKLVDKQAEIINGRNYSRWRHKGVAYEIRDATYDTSNKTLASGFIFKHEGERYARRGYWGDIVVSPYISFGVECEEKSFFKKSNNIMMKVGINRLDFIALNMTSEDVAQYNVLSMLHEVTHRRPYVAPATVGPETAGTAPQSMVITEESDEMVDQVSETEEKSKENSSNKDYEFLSVDQAKVYFLPISCFTELHKKEKFKHLFNIVYVATTMSQAMTPEFSETFSDSAEVIMETGKFLLELKKDQEATLCEKIVGLAESAGCKVLKSDLAQNGCHVVFKFERPT